MTNFIINTLNRSSITQDPGACTIALRNNYAGNYRIEKAVIPISYYTIDNGNNVFSWYENKTATTHSNTLTSGFYTISSLCTEIGSRMNTDSSTAHYSATYSTTTNKITITNSNADTFKVMNYTYGSGTCSRITGFQQDSSSLSATQTADSVFDLHRNNYISLIIGSGRSYWDDRQVLATTTIPNDKLSGEILIWEPPTLDYYIEIPNSNTLSVGLLHEDGSFISMNGINYVISLKRVSG